MIIACSVRCRNAKIALISEKSESNYGPPKMGGVSFIEKELSKKAG